MIVHAAILKINLALENEEPSEILLPLLEISSAGLRKVDSNNVEEYRDTLIAAKMEKMANAPDNAYLDGSDGANGCSNDVDIYDTNLTRDEIQRIINVINATVAAERKRVVGVYYKILYKSALNSF